METREGKEWSVVPDYQRVNMHSPVRLALRGDQTGIASWSGEEWCTSKSGLITGHRAGGRSDGGDCEHMLRHTVSVRVGIAAVGCRAEGRLN